MEDDFRLAPDKPELAPKPLEFPVIGVGASAGGLEAFEHFLRNVDPNFEAAYILVQHLDPNHDSLLAELLAKYTELEVRQITDGTEVRPRSVYIIPSASGISIDDGILSLVDFDAPRGFRRPIDDFFQSLALDQGPNSAAVVLSGTGGDGTVGIRYVKEAGGLAVVQDPEEAAYDGMPSSAIATGLIDFVQSVDDIPATLSRFFEVRKHQPATRDFDRENFINQIMTILHENTGHDFSYYKINTVLRRVQRRMQVLNLTQPEAYVKALRTDVREAEALFQDLLINVTSFFRDPEVFDLLRREVIPQIVRNARVSRTIRVWVPGCSSGEEAYSIAILFAEAIAREKDKPDVQIFATDIDEEMLRRARIGVYMLSDVADLPPELVNRYFTATEDGFSVNPTIRDMVRVSAHSVIKDPPFSRLDLVSCRNLLIYFDHRLQSRVLPLFHYSLRQGGWLLLGSAENLAGRDDLFDVVAREERIYRKIAKTQSNFVLPLTPRQRSSEARGERVPPPEPHDTKNERSQLLMRRVMERYTLPHVVVNNQGHVIHSSARTSPYLRLSVGEPSSRLLDLAPSELRPALRSVLGAMEERRRRVIRRGIKIELDDAEQLTVDLIADPLDSVDMLIVFRETNRVMRDDDDMDADIGEFRTEQWIQELEDELSETRASLRTTVEELETSNEELKSSNEEMMSMNEELQSANEELSTVNEELKSKLDELALLNADHVNFLESSQIATVFVDRELRVRSFTPVAKKLFRLVERDKGRPIMDVRASLESSILTEALEKALAGEKDVSEQVSIGSDTYTFRALPYVDHEGMIDGAVLVFEDVTQLVSAQTAALELEKAAADSRREIERLYESAPVGMALVGRDRKYRRINKSLAEYNGFSVEEHLGKTITEMLPEIGPKIDDVITQVFETGEGVSRWELEANAPTDHRMPEVFELDIYPVPGESEDVDRVGIIVHRVTEARQMERDLRHLMAELQHRVKNSLATVMSIVRQTVRTADSRETMAEALTSRIGALAATHSLLSAADWHSISLSQVLDQEFAPYRDYERLTFEGPDISLGVKPALTLTLILHEMATNAVKYGALSASKGTVSVTWSMDEGRFNLRWEECVEGAVSEPEHRGFGIRFIERSVEHDLDGKVDLTWGAGGLTYDIEADLDRVIYREANSK